MSDFSTGPMTDSGEKKGQKDFELIANETSSYFSPSTGKLSAKRYPRGEKLSDRFIPKRKGSKFTIAFTEAHNDNMKENNPLRNQGLGSSLNNNNNSNNANGANNNNNNNGSNNSNSNGNNGNNNPNNMNNDKDDASSLSLAHLYKNYILGIKPSDQEIIKKDNFQRFQNKNVLVYKENMAMNPLESNQYSSHNFLPFQVDEDLTTAYLRNYRKISKVPFKVLDAPALQDDFYLNLIDWSMQNYLAVGLSSCVYLWSAYTSKVSKLCDLGPNNSVTSVCWSANSNMLGVGTNNGEIQLWDTQKLKNVRNFGGHSARVGALAWSSMVLSTGSRDKSILNRDPRAAEPFISRLSGHKQEVCGLKWSFDEQQLASGGNDNKLFIWNAHSSLPISKFSQHTAAVKALAWSPHQHGLLASGGGTADRTIRFWNTLNYCQTNYIDTGSQVCNLMFSRNVNELISTHGYSLNQIIVWKYPDLEKMATLTGHTYRVLYLAMSPDGQTIVTGAGDETLRFWNVFPNQEEHSDKSTGSSMLCENLDLR